MALTYNLGFVPKWYIADLVGKPLGGGYLVAFSNINHTTLNLIYQDPDGLEPYPLVPVPNTNLNGILFDENGSQGPFYFLFNTATPNILYYLEVYDADGVLQWTMDDYIPPSGTGGSIITSVANLTNIIVNSPLWRMINQNNTALTAVAPGVSKTIAPSVHSGLSNNVTNSSGIYTGPDITFLKNSTGETDNVNFVLFPLGVKTLPTDVTPIGYFNYTCTAATAGTIKCLQIPITRNVQNLSQQIVTITFWARCNSGASTLTTNWFQFFGDGAASGSAAAPFNVFTLTAAWAPYSISIAVPSTVGKTLGLCGNDGLFLQFEYPLNQTTNIDFTLPRMFLGSIAPGIYYETNDSIDAVINSPRTGHLRVGYDTVAEYGYVLMNDTTIGQTGSGATTSSSETFPLYNLLYQNVLDAWAPISGGRSGNAVTDFLAGKTMTLPKALGRALAQAGLATTGVTTWALGQNGGTQTPLIALGQIPHHLHVAPPNTQYALTVTSGGFGSLPGGSTVNQQGITGDVSGLGVQAGFDVTQPSTFMNYFIKL